MANKKDEKPETQNDETPEEVYARQPKQYWSRQKARIDRTNRQGWLVERIWPEGTVHLLSGPSGVGKTSWLLPTIKDWYEGKPIMGFKSFPKEYVYLMCDRSETDLQRTLNRLQLGDWDIHAYSIESLGHDPRCMIEPSTLTIERLPNIFPWAKVFIIEAYNWFYKEGGKNGAVGDYRNTLRFWSSVRDAFAQKDLTIIATTHEAKGNEYTKTRDKVYGNVGQVAVAGTIMSMSYGEKNDDVRFLNIAPRDAKEFTVEYKFDEKGLLEFVSEGSADEKEDSSSHKLLDGKLRRCLPGDNLPIMTILSWAQELSLTERTVYRWLSSRVEQGKLLKIAKGLYCVPTEQ